MPFARTEQSLIPQTQDKNTKHNTEPEKRITERRVQFTNPRQNKVMINNRIKNYCGLAVATLLLGGANLALADTADLTIQDFTADASGTGVEWGSSTVAWDGGVGDPVGSLAFTVTFGSGSDSPMVDYVCIAGGNPWYQPTRINFSTYTNIQFDIKWDPTSDITIAQFNDLSTWNSTMTNSLGQTIMQGWAGAGYMSGSVQGIDIELCGGPAGQRGPSIGTTNIPAGAATGWVHCSVPINPAMAQIDGANGVVFNKWINQQWGIANPAVARFWIDNVMLGGIHGPIPPPKVSLAPAHAGLNLFAGTSGGNDRENIRTALPASGTNYAWVGRGSTPVSYSFTITNYPSSANPYFMINAFLIPQPYDRPSGTNSTLGLESACDWNEATCIFMDFEEYNDGSGDWRFRYKTNSPGANGSYYSDVLAELRDYTGVLGTWTLTFSNNTSVTMTSPTGVSTNFTFSADKVSWFADTNGVALPLYYYVGCRGNGSGATTAAVLSDVKIHGSVDSFEDNFMTDTVLDTNKWNIAAAYAPSIQMVPTTPKPVYWVNWTLPANGYQLESSASLFGPWLASTQPTLAYAGVVTTLVSANEMPSVNQGYFRAAQLAATQLQVLLPGEVNAPGTVSGKTGTPSAQTVGNPFNLTINACDANWNIVQSVNDSVAITSSDTTAWLPPNTPLVNGTVTITGNFYFDASGTWTVTATDVPNPGTISAGTSTPITIP